MTIRMKSVKNKEGYWILKEKRRSTPGVYERMLMMELEFGFGNRKPEYATDIYGRVYEKEVTV